MIKISESVYGLMDKRFPDKWKQILNQYSAGALNINEDSDWKKLLRGNLVNITIFSVIILTVIVITTRVIQPLFWEYSFSRILTAAVTIVILLPFFWALAFRKGNKEAYSRLWLDQKQRGPIIILQLGKILLALFYLGFLFDRLFSHKIAFIGVSLTFVILLFLSKRIQRFYGKIELRFLTNYNQNQNEFNTIQKSIILPSWDTHISVFKLTSYSPFIGKTLLDSKIREKFGINIATIERDDFIINVSNVVPRRYNFGYRN